MTTYITDQDQTSIARTDLTGGTMLRDPIMQGTRKQQKINGAATGAHNVTIEKNLSTRFANIKILFRYRAKKKTNIKRSQENSRR